MTNPEFPAIEWHGPCKSRFGPWSKRMIVWHCTANTAPAINEAQYAARRTDGVGMHLAADVGRAIQTLQTTMSTGHVGSTTGNRHGISIELVGRNGDSAELWRPRIERAAPFVRLAMNKHGIPNRWLTISEMRAGAAGHVTHDMCRIAFGSTDHTDPGTNFPKQYVVDVLAGAVSTPAPVPLPIPAVDWVSAIMDDMPTLRFGAESRTVKKLQAGLNASGARIAEDGDFGDGTKSALTAYQRARGLSADGVAGPQVWRSLFGRHMAVVRRGSTGHAVRLVQALANLWGIGLAEDGNYGPATEAGIRNVQSREGAGADGITGAVTWRVLLTR